MSNTILTINFEVMGATCVPLFSAPLFSANLCRLPALAGLTVQLFSKTTSMLASFLQIGIKSQGGPIFCDHYCFASVAMFLVFFGRVPAW